MASHLAVVVHLVPDGATGSILRARQAGMALVSASVNLTHYARRPRMRCSGTNATQANSAKVDGAGASAGSGKAKVRFSVISMSELTSIPFSRKSVTPLLLKLALVSALRSVTNTTPLIRAPGTATPAGLRGSRSVNAKKSPGKVT